MSMLDSLKAFARSLDGKVIIAADGQTRTHRREGGRLVESVPAGGVGMALDRVSQVLHATYITRARTPEDREVTDEEGKTTVRGTDGAYTLRRIEVSEEQTDQYYFGFSNQSLWPLFHPAFEKPVFERSWYEGYVTVNRRFADAVNAEIEGRAVVWVNDYQLALVPGMLERDEDVALAFFWHIPWPSWELFRILPYRRELLESLLCCDFIGFHTVEYARNFLSAVQSELDARVDERTLTVQYEGRRIRLGALPIGVDSDVIREQIEREELADAPQESPAAQFAGLCDHQAVILGADRLDYTKGIRERLEALDRFFERYPACLGRATYVGIMSPTREAIPAYQELKDAVVALADQINAKYARDGWEPLCMVYEGMPREEIIRLYGCARVCLVTPLADGLNLVAKEFVAAASGVDDPGMLVLSEFAGAAEELRQAILINPFDPDGVAEGIAEALSMHQDERLRRIERMAVRIDRDNVYVWAEAILRRTIAAAHFGVHRVA
jgi:trehalose 6-phosphate synthase